MDYDDNDFQNQTFHLVGEESNNKFPPGLRSYSLPKFDLDDNLQVNLRFDSLVESEVLLGAQNREENQWIEDFSGGSSGIEFSSSAAESCSISRRNNVWSEATSSESVEMLLKSVGQYEIIMGQNTTIIEESEAGDGACDLTKQMDLHVSSQDGSAAPPKILNALDVDSAFPIELSKEASDQLVESTPKLTGKGEKSGYASLKDLDLSYVSKNCNSLVETKSEDNLFVDDRKFKEANPNQMEGTPSDRSEGRNEMRHDYSVSFENMHPDSSATSDQTLPKNSGELNCQLVPPKAEGPQDVKTDRVRDLTKDVETDDQNCRFDEVETFDDHVLNESVLELKVDSTVQASVLHGEVFFPDGSVHMSKWEGVVSSNDAGKGALIITGSGIRETSQYMAGSESHVDIEPRTDETFSNSVLTTGLVEQISQGYSCTKESSLEDGSHEYPSEQITQGHSSIQSSERQGNMLQADGHELISGISVNNGDDSLTAEEKNYKGQGNVSVMSDSSRLMVVCSSGSVHISQATVNMKKDDDGLGDHRADIGTEAQVSSPLKVESMQTCDKMIIQVEPSDVIISHSDAPLLENENARSTSDPGGKVESETDGSVIADKNISPFAAERSFPIPETMVHETPAQVLPDESVSTIVVSDVMKLASDNKLSGADNFPLEKFVDDEVIEHEEDAKSSLPVKKFANMGTKEETVTTISLKPSSSSVVKVRFQTPESAVSATECEGRAFCEDAVEMLNETVGQLSSPLGIDKITSQNTSQALVAHKDALGCAGDLMGSLVVDESPVKENDGAEAVVGVSFVEHEVVVLKSSGSYNETLKLPIPPSLVESSLGVDPKNMEEKEASGKDGHINLAGKESDSLNGSGDLFKPAIMLSDDSELHSVEIGSASPNSNDPNCGSPTVISCNEPSQCEKENHDLGKKSLEDQNSTSSVYRANEVISMANDAKVKSLSKDDTSFTFEVGSLPDLSERTGNDWRRFSSIQPHESPQTAQGSPPTTISTVCQINSMISPHMSHVTPKKSGGRNVRKSSKGGHQPADATATPASGKAAGRETPKNEEGSLKDDLLVREGPQEGKGCLDRVTLVSDGSIDQGANQVSSTSHDPRKVDVPKDDRSFTFKVSSLAYLPERETVTGWKPFPSLQPNEFPQTVGASPSTSSFTQPDPQILQEISRGNTRTSGVKHERRRYKADDKTRPASGKVVVATTSKEGKLLEAITPKKQIKERGSRSSTGVVSRDVPAEEMQPFGFIEGSNTKPSPVPTVQSSNLPDLNTSVSTSASFQQPFTDLQQVQLRAQIFVYGSLIQGTTPDEACMISAFGESDGQRNMWENVWRVAVERLQRQKSPLSSNSETPLHFHSVAKTPATTTRQSFHQSESPSTPGRAGTKGAPLTMISPVIPMSSPLWTISTPGDGLFSSSSSSVMTRGHLIDPHQSLIQLNHPYQSPHLRHYIGNTNPWHLQAPPPATWAVSSPQSTAVNAPNVKHSTALPISETVYVASVRDSSSVPHDSRPSGMMQQPAVPPSSLVPNGSPTSVSACTPFPVVDVKRAAVPSGNHASTEQKSRKRKKNSASMEVGQMSSFVQPTSAAEPLSGDRHYLPTTSVTPVATASISVPKVSSDSSFVLTTSLMPPTPSHNQLIAGPDTEQQRGIILSEETCSQIKQAKQQADDASAFAASAVKHSQSVWSQLAIHKSSGLVSDVEAKLASAAVAAAAAAAVAKAAAAAAKIASDAALQAKLFADEALVSSSKLVNIASDASLHDGVKNLGNIISPASILKGKDRTNSSDSILVAAKEAAKKRVEAASAATRRAENLDAVVKAAGMAAEAVSQAGTIVAMGDPIPFTLNDLVEAGQEGYWKVQHLIFPEQPVKLKSNTTNMEQQSDIDCDKECVDSISTRHFSEQQLKDNKRVPDQGKKVLPPKDLPRQVESSNWLASDMRPDPTANTVKGPEGPKPGETSDSAKPIAFVSESQIGSVNVFQNIQNEEYGVAHQSIRSSAENHIEEGSSVEVLSYEDGLRRAWFPAKVLSLKDGKAYVCYTERARDEDSGKSTEWVPLDGEGGKAPRIRVPYPVSVLKYEGTRKRQRAARGDYAWSVGDKVDARIRDSWWEGTITEKATEDDTSWTVQLSAQGDVSVVRSWNLRPTLIWRDDQWIEWSRSSENIISSNEGDTPQEKRAKLARSGAETDAAIEARGIDKIFKHIPGTEETGKPESSRPLALSSEETMFNIGKDIKEDNNPDALGTKRTGLQKQGSRVVFGVPKPGKKRKFMDVSKHYIANRVAKVADEGDGSIKFTKFLIPQESAPRGWKNPSKVVNKGKRVAESKPNFLKTGKPQNITAKNRSERDNHSSSTYVFSASTEGVAHDLLPNTRAAVMTHDGNTSDNVADAPSSMNKPSSAAAANLVNKGKAVVPLGHRLARNGEKDHTTRSDKSGKSIPDAVEPRRSNRRIQPTSRLLEGLQSSLIISKISSAHDRGTKGQHRSAASTRGNNHG